MKKEYSTPEITVVKFEELDVITTSGEPGGAVTPPSPPTPTVM